MRTPNLWARRQFGPMQRRRRAIRTAGSQSIIQKERLLDTIVVVTRYFGGIRQAPGVGSGIRQTAKVGIDASGVVKKVHMGRLPSLSTIQLGQVQHLLQAEGI